MGVHCLCETRMLLKILLLTLLSSFADAGEAEAKQGSEGFENLVEKLESGLRDVEKKFEDAKEKLEQMEIRMKEKEEEEDKEKKELKAKLQEIETRLEELEANKKEWEKEEKEKGLDASTSKQNIENLEESSRKESALNFPISNITALTNPSLRDLPIVIISASRMSAIGSPQTVTFDSFLANFNNADHPGGGSGDLELDSGVFTCLTPGYYTVSFSVFGFHGPNYHGIVLYLYKNGTKVLESLCEFSMRNGVLNADVGGTQSRILILHMEAGDTLELRIHEGKHIGAITFNIELVAMTDLS